MIIRKYANKVVQDLSNPRCKDWNLLNNLLQGPAVSKRK
jgi:hypothetical protein